MVPPGVRVFDAMTKSDEASAVYVEPSHVMTGASAVSMAEAVPKNCVLVPMTAKLVPSGMEMGVLETVIVPPGANVWPAMTNWEAVFAVYVEPANFNMARLEDGAEVARD